MSKLKRKRWSKSDAIEFQAAWAASGLSQLEFCRQRNVPLSTFSTWRRKLRDSETSSSNSSPHFVEVTRSKNQPRRLNHSASESDIVIVTPSGFSIRLGNGFCGNDLKAALTALESC
jgi:transposase-like protein